jgi:hypothetical protein
MHHVFIGTYSIYRIQMSTYEYLAMLCAAKFRHPYMNTRFASLLAALFPLIIYAVMEQERRTNPEPKMAIATTGSHLLFLQEGFIDASYQHAAGQCGRAVRTRPSRRPEPELTRPCSPPQSAETLPYHLVGSRLSHGEMKLCPTPLTRVLALDRVVAEQ